MIYRCPSCGLAYAVPDAYAGLVCGCRLVLPVGSLVSASPAPSPAASTLARPGDGPDPGPTYWRSGGGGRGAW